MKTLNSTKLYSPLHIPPGVFYNQLFIIIVFHDFFFNYCILFLIDVHVFDQTLIYFYQKPIQSSAKREAYPFLSLRRAKRAHKKDGCTLIFTSGWLLLLLLGSVNRCDQTDNDINPKIYMNHFFSLIKKALFLFWDKIFFSKKKKEKTCKFGHFWPFFGVCQAQRPHFLIYRLENLYTDSSHHPTDPFFSVFQKKIFFNFFFLKNGSKIRSFFNNSRILIKNDFYCCFSILNMILLSKMTFCHFWGYPFLQKLAKIDISLIIDRLP